VLRAHPFEVQNSLGLPPAGVALAACVLIAVVLLLARPRLAAGEPAAGVPDPDSGPLPRWAWLPRAVGVALLVGAVYLARRGPVREIDNLTALVLTGILWPVVLLSSLVGGAWVWRALDPVDTLVRGAERVAGAPAGGPVDGPVWGAVATATGAMAFLHGVYLPTSPLSPPVRAQGWLVAGYVIAVVAVGTALGRGWAARTEVIGLLARWAGLRTGLSRWAAPRGAEAVLGAVIGGTLVGTLRRTGVWFDVLGSDHPTLWTMLAVVGGCGLGALVCEALGWWAERREAPGSVAAVLVPVVVAYAVATLLRRLLTTLQLAWRAVSDPLGRGADLFGTAEYGVDADLLGETTRLYLGSGLVVAAGLFGAWVLVRRTTRGRQQDPAAVALYLSVALGVLGVTTQIAP
jgi:hypothetical protein